MDEETRWSAFLVARQLCNSNLSIQPFSVLLSSSLFIYSYLILTLLTKPVQGAGAEAVNLCHGECGPWGSIIAPILKASTLPLVGLLARYQEPSFWRYGCNQELPAPPNTYPQGSLCSPWCRTFTDHGCPVTNFTKLGLFRTSCTNYRGLCRMYKPL